MKQTLLVAAALACVSGTAMAGPNANGTLIVALSDGVVFTFDEDTYCGSHALDSCDAAIGRYDNSDTAVLNVLAAFSGAASPRLAGVTFGVAYNDSEIFFQSWGSCGDFELATGGWPAPNEGTAVTYSVAQESSLTDVYWFAAYNYYGNANSFDLVAHPGQGANFADDDVPSNLDPISALGSFGFSTDGNVPCPQDDDLPGACCFADGSCQILLEAECSGAGGDFQGSGTDCDTADCPQPATGACCIDAACSIRTESECLDAGGDYLGDDTSCDGDPCVVPTIESSWGEIKGIYR